MIYPSATARNPESSMVYERPSFTTEQPTRRFVVQYRLAHFFRPKETEFITPEPSCSTDLFLIGEGAPARRCPLTALW